MKLDFPCDLQWSDLAGTSNTVRHCDRCDRNVFNLSGMTKARAEALLAEHGKGLCVHFVARDGHIVHDGDPLMQLRRQKRGAWRLLAGALVVQSVFAAAGHGSDNYFDPFYGLRDAIADAFADDEYMGG